MGLQNAHVQRCMVFVSSLQGEKEVGQTWWPPWKGPAHYVGLKVSSKLNKTQISRLHSVQCSVIKTFFKDSMRTKSQKVTAWSGNFLRTQTFSTPGATCWSVKEMIYRSAHTLLNCLYKEALHSCCWRINFLLWFNSLRQTKSLFCTWV